MKRREHGRRKPDDLGVLNVDGSLPSLYIEPEYRGRGLSKAVTRKLFQGFARGR